MSIILIGMSGSGKTTIGKALSARLDYGLVDTDQMIKEREGRDIEDIFKVNGEEYFRDMESEVLGELLDKRKLIVATGGGIILRPENIQLLKKMGKVYLLDANIHSLVKNLEASKEVRPLLEGSGQLYSKLSKMYSAREKIYRSACDLAIDVNGRDVDEIVNDIIGNHNS